MIDTLTPSPIRQFPLAGRAAAADPAGASGGWARSASGHAIC